MKAILNISKIQEYANRINKKNIHFVEIKFISENNLLVIVNFYKDKSFAYFDIDFDKQNYLNIVNKCLITLEDCETDK